MSMVLFFSLVAVAPLQAPQLWGRNQRHTHPDLCLSSHVLGTLPASVFCPSTYGGKVLIFFFPRRDKDHVACVSVAWFPLILFGILLQSRVSSTLFSFPLVAVYLFGLLCRKFVGIPAPCGVVCLSFVAIFYG